VFFGIKLNKITMKIAYEMIIDRTNAQMSEKRIGHIENVLEALENETTFGPTKELLFKATWKLNVNNNIRDFIWKAQRNILKCGKLFLQWGGEWTERAYCECGVIEEPEHIILDCPLGEQVEIWEETKKILRKLRKIEWTITWPQILGIGCLPAALYIYDEDTKNKMQYETKAFTTIVLNATWHIWKTRCQRVIAEESQTTEEIVNKFREDIREQCQIEWHSMEKMRNKKKATKQRKNFIKTWIETGILRTTQAGKDIDWNTDNT
jgi:hypothetical protein